MSRTIKLTIAYDGTDFHGWQIQPEHQTVQGVLTAVLAQLTHESPVLCGAGRTDAGVHAWGQVAHFQTESGLSASAFTRALNALLPAAIRIRDTQEVEPGFHARRHARAKTYQYRIYRGDAVPPFVWRYVLHDAQTLNFESMARAAGCFAGRHDFTSFAASTGSEEEDRERTMVRDVERSELLHVTSSGYGMSAESLETEALGARIAPISEEWVYVIQGQSFLRSMVRKIVGTLLEVGRGRISPEAIPELFERRDRTCSGPTAPPQGLCLVSVTY